MTHKDMSELRNEMDRAELTNLATGVKQVWVNREAVLLLMRERAILLEACQAIAASDHAEDGGPECDHPSLADKAIAAVLS